MPPKEALAPSLRGLDFAAGKRLGECPLMSATLPPSRLNAVPPPSKREARIADSSTPLRFAQNDKEGTENNFSIYAKTRLASVVPFTFLYLYSEGRYHESTAE